MKPMMGMMNMMAECERMMQMTDRYQSVPNRAVAKQSAAAGEALDSRYSWSPRQAAAASVPVRS
jgi:hypothetical protein